MDARRAKPDAVAPTPRVRRASVRSSVTRISFVDLAMLTAQVLGLALAATGALAEWPWLTLAGSVLSIGSQIMITAMRSPINRALSFIGVSRAIRILLLVLLAVFLELALASDVAADNLTHGATVWLLPLAGALCFLATFADQWGARGYRGGGLAWRGLETHGLADSKPAPAGIASAIIALVPALILTGGVPLVIAAENGTASDLELVGAIAAVCGVASCVISVVLRARLLRGGSRVDRILQLRTALDAYSPEVVIFFSAPASATYALNVWIQTANAFTARTLIVSKEAGHLDRLDRTAIPTVFAARARDIEYLTVASVKVVLHPTTANKVFEIMRLRGLLQVFIGHGDSDKVSSFNPYSKVFDEIWVSGPAGIDRYTALGDGFRTDQFVTVGRPQLAEIATVAADGSSEVTLPRPTVLYAPTWEGFLEQSNYSSLASMGVAMVEAMLAMPTPPRILFKPHPSSGHRREDMREAQEEIGRLLAEANADHQVFQDGTVSLYAAFNSADVMITDISSVLTDFLASHKPYLVTNPRDEPLADFLAAFPSSAAGSIIDSDLTSQQGAGFVPAIEHALDGDAAGRPARIALADYLLGPVSDDPVRAFVDQVTAAIERAKARYPAPRIVPTPTETEGRPLAAAIAGTATVDGVGAATG
ncbi:MAG TPA: CDP-glycerol glycerophosphotransferase family protein [Galbitalea sp.]|nr:CDP-glycerol glycerophosphotransferase family protein [Galbitalea sp.]